MKRYFVVLIGLCALIILLLTACGNTSKTEYDDYTTLWNKFVVVESLNNFKHGTLYITYDKDTKVMYYIGVNSYDSRMCPIYNADGSVRIYGK